MFAVKTAGLVIRIKKHCSFIVDAIRETIVVSVVYSSPTKVLSNATGIPPPVSQTELHSQIISSGLGNHLIQVHEGFFIPASGSQTERMSSRPIRQVCDRHNVVWSTFSKGPYTHYLDSRRGSLP